MASLLTDEGLDKPTEDDINSEIKQSLWASISNQLNLASPSPLGQIVGIFSERVANIYDLIEAVLNARKPDSASGTSLRSLSLITGTLSRTATKTQVTVTVNLDDGFSQAAGTMVAHKTGDPTARFVNVDLVENDSGITDDFDVMFEAETAGALEILAGQLEVIAEPLTGWNSVTNALDGDTGLADDTDVSLRLRREAELTAQGASFVDAIRADILDPDDGLGDNITHCRVIENVTDSVDDNGLPGHSFEVIARGVAMGAPEGQALAEFIFENKPAGIETYGTESDEVIDSQGNTHTIGYSWIDTVDVYLEIDLVVDPVTFPLDGDDQVIAALLAVEDTYAPGSDIIAERLKAAAFTVTGVIDVDELRLGLTASPVGTVNLAVGLREIGDLDSSRIEVAHV